MLDWKLSRSVALVGDDARGEGFCGELSVRGLGDDLFVALSDRGRLNTEFGIKLLATLTAVLRGEGNGSLAPVAPTDLDDGLTADVLGLVFDPLIDLVVPSTGASALSSSSSESSMTSDDLNFPLG